MEHIKKFEDFDFSKKSPSNNYYSCDECDAVWEDFNETSKNCKYCGSDEIEDINEDEWNELVKSRSAQGL